MVEETKGFNKLSGGFIIAYHIALLAMWPLYFAYNTPSLGMIIATVVLFFTCGIAITGGYHRFYSHLTYKTNKVVEAILLFFGTMATQGSALRWSYEHRLHHAFVDGDKDPYTVKKGFWHAHCLWLFFKTREIDMKVVSDLGRNKMVMFQHKYYPWLMLFTNIIAFVTVGWALNDYLGAFVLVWWTRLFCLHHCTWFINSLAHYWGSQSYSQEHTAVDNYVISLLTFGEGYHNYHHTFAYDYRNGIRWYHFDPTKWLIWTLNKCGLAHDLKKVNDRRITAQLILADKNDLMEKLKSSFYAGKEALETKVVEMSAAIMDKVSQMSALIEQSECYKKMDNVSKEMRDQIQKDIKSLKKSLNVDWKNWKKLSKTIRKLDLQAA